MAKGPAISPPAAAQTPKKRKRVSLAVKLDIIKRNESGQGPSEIGRTLGLSASTVGTILKNAPRLKEVGESVTPTTATKLSRSRDCVMENMERLLSTWIEDCNQRNMPLCLKLIQEKALSLWKDLQEKQQPSEDTPQAAESFNASRGWFNRFKKRANLHNIKVTGEAASTDLVAANAYPAQLQDIIEKEQERAHEDDDDDDQEESVPPKPKQLTLKGVRRILDLLGQATAAMAEEDPK
ncbi:hypothetical protein Pcinc_021162 [Petrolisthes cinctipes]|uniref:HTH CENPB-type domain-containing protein n=1 Tax=Petrolisthes cinctipes TaxID=88211 RepID=A0AAE1FHL4_PETCI|nr:hypothetical protein Pcinc_021162 [Petrolisthes cinctipes]